MGMFSRMRRRLWVLVIPFAVEVLHHVCADLLIEWSRSEIKQPGWHKMVGVIASAFGRSYPLVVSGTLTLLSVAFVLVMAEREEREERLAVAGHGAIPATVESVPDATPDEKEIEILQMFVEFNGQHTVEDVAKRMVMNRHVAGYHLDRLRDMHMIVHSLREYRNSHPVFIISREGRDFLVRSNRIK